MNQAKRFNKVAVLGAGVMGAQIAAHCINSKVPVILFDLPAKAKEGEAVDPYRIVSQALGQLKKLKPAPMGLTEEADLIEMGHYEADLEKLKECDLVIEAIAERLDWKHDLYKRVSPYIHPQAVFATNTSGLSIQSLAAGFDADLRKRFCGVHFFNPPRYMHLLELIPTADTDPQLIDRLDAFMTSVLGKGVVRAKDTPNFVANRVGVFSILAVMHEAQKYQLSFDTVDALTGSKLGRAKSATFRTSDVVGIDTMAHVIKTMEDNLANDPFSAIYKTPEVVKTLIAHGALGQKTKAGFYKKVGKDILVFDPSKNDYIASTGAMEPLVERILKKPIAERLALLRESDDPQAQFLWAIFRDIFHYVAIHLESIADSAREIDFAMKWGFGWDKGPFEDWQDAGWLTVAQWIQEDIDQGRALAKVNLPAWVFDGPVAQTQKIHTEQGSWSASRKTYVKPSALPVYERQLFRASLSGDGAPSAKSSGQTIFENDGARAWVHPHKADVLVLSFKSKMNTIGPDVLSSIVEAIERAEQDFAGLVIWQPTSLKLGAPGGPFSAGANLEAAMPLFMKNGAAGIEPFVKQFQDTMMRIKYAKVPVVAAVSGIALGGGCELLMHTAKRVVAFESYIGLVEIGVGLLPAGGGLKEAAIRAHRAMQAAGSPNYVDAVKASFENAAMAKVSGSALEAMKMGYLLPSDQIVMNVHELLSQACEQVRSMSAAGYTAPLMKKIPVGGSSLIATITGQLVNLKDGRFISEHDYFIAHKIISVIAGGEVDAGTLVTEDWLLKLERQAFVELLGTQKTQERIMGLLQTGKPLRN